ncbi:MAG: GNAT family N-acetyltransferase [Pyrinomonadaceae bacterium]
MEPAIDIVHAESDSEIAAVRQLFLEYEEWLGLDLCFQGFEEELSTLPGRYRSPEGRLYLALVEGEAAGCVALRRFGDGICEMKRLYVRPGFRGLRLGASLVELLISTARGIGYSRLLLDTYPPKMEQAVRMYRSFGFEEVGPYYDNPNSETLFMALEL